MAKTLEPVELLKLHRENVENGGNVNDLIRQYKEKTGSEAKDTSLKSSLTNELSAIRKDLIARGFSEEDAEKAVPRYKRSKRVKKRDAAVDFAASLIAPANAEASA